VPFDGSCTVPRAGRLITVVCDSTALTAVFADPLRDGWFPTTFGSPLLLWPSLSPSFRGGRRSAHGRSGATFSPSGGHRSAGHRFRAVAVAGYRVRLAVGQLAHGYVRLPLASA